jgi:hypothetical protein
MKKINLCILKQNKKIDSSQQKIKTKTIKNEYNKKMRTKIKQDTKTKPKTKQKLRMHNIIR